MKTLSPAAVEFATEYEFYCQCGDCLVKVAYNAKTNNFDKKDIDFIFECIPNEINAFMLETNKTEDDVREYIVDKLCAAAEDCDDAPVIF